MQPSPWFQYADWVDETERPPDWWDRDKWPTWRALNARRRWSNAGKAWLAERGRERDWYALVSPDTARILASQYPRMRGRPVAHR